MKKHLAILTFTLLFLALAAHTVAAQSGGTVKGACKDVQGNPLPDAVVVWSNQDNGQKYTLKTNKKGEFYSLGVSTGKYKIVLYRTADDLKANKPLDSVSNFQVTLDENTLDFDLKQEAEKQAKGEGLTPEQVKERQELADKQKKESFTVKSLNDKLTAAKTAADGGDYDTAIKTLEDANQLDASHDLIWFKLADYYRLSASKQTDKAEKDKRLGTAIDDYQKAIQMKQATPPDKDKDPAATAKALGGYYNNMAEAYAKSGKVDDAVKTYSLAAQTDPAGAAQYYFNTGAVLTNAGRPDEALAAFDKCIAADPTRAEAYYQRGVNLLGKATLQGDKTVAVPGTAEAFQKYLELAPTGPNAQSAKDLLASIGSTVETSYGTKKKPVKK
jgi:tetratricopeptide (TPR) repeat protein